MLHVDPGSPARIGNRVTIGHRCVVHGCTIEDDCLIGMGGRRHESGRDRNGKHRCRRGGRAGKNRNPPLFPGHGRPGQGEGYLGRGTACSASASRPWSMWTESGSTRTGKASSKSVELFGPVRLVRRVPMQFSYKCTKTQRLPNTALCVLVPLGENIEALPHRSVPFIYKRAEPAGISTGLPVCKTFVN